MAINRGVLGSQTGSMGGITASNWKGRNVYKQKVPATNSSNTPAQAAQRRKFAALAKLAGLYGTLLRVGYNSAAASITEQNAFVRANFDAVTDNGEVSTVDFSLVSIATGVLAPAVGLQIVAAPQAGSFTVKWVDNSNGADALPTDQALGLVRDRSTGQTYVLESGFKRGDETQFAAGIFPANTLLSNMEVFLFFKRVGSTATSPSRYARGA